MLKETYDRIMQKWKYDFPISCPCCKHSGRDFAKADFGVYWHSFYEKNGPPYVRCVCMNCGVLFETKLIKKDITR